MNGDGDVLSGYASARAFSAYRAAFSAHLSVASAPVAPVRKISG